MQDPIWTWGAVKTAANIKAGKTSSEAVVTAHLDRMDQTAALNAVTTRYDEDALAAARAADQVLAQGQSVGPLHGVPVTIKENADQKTRATSNGVRGFRDLIAQDDAPVVKRFLAAGAVPIGRTNTPELSWRIHTDNELFGATLNPWNEDLTPGGSSGGAASALAVGVGCIAHGNDLAGSVRCPAYCCGVTGLRPTQGRIAFYNSTAATERPITIQLASVQGPLARNVADVKLAFAVMCGADTLDPWSLPSFQPTPDSSPRVATVTQIGDLPSDPAVTAALSSASRALTVAGYDVESATPPDIRAVMDIYMSLLVTEMAMVKESVVDKFGSSQLRRALEIYMMIAPPLDLPGYAQALAKRSHFQRVWDRFLGQYPIILAPVFTTPPFRAGQDIASIEDARDIWNSAPFMTAMNYLDLPCMSVPTDVSAQGIPVGVQVIGPRYGEQSVLKAAAAIEAGCGTPSDFLLKTR